MAAGGSCHYHAYIMMARTQITLDVELQKRARKRAAQLGVSLAEYIRRLVRRDLGERSRPVGVEVVFDLGGSGASDVAADKDLMVSAAIRRKGARKRAGS